MEDSKQKARISAINYWKSNLGKRDYLCNGCSTPISPSEGYLSKSLVSPIFSPDLLCEKCFDARTNKKPSESENFVLKEIARLQSELNLSDNTEDFVSIFPRAVLVLSSLPLEKLDDDWLFEFLCVAIGSHLGYQMLNNRLTN
ncbi:MAG: hypothetical protein JNJ56_11970 [Ignavibacteria bacterium]|nr:hypothetical protein [Ignavibacteria bacterium]